MPKQLAIDLELLQMAFEDRDGDGQWVLDRETGEVLRLDEFDELREQIEQGDERYLVIPYQGSDAGYRDMADFIASLDDNRLRALLDVAIRGSGSFRRFKDVLQEHPEQRERWFALQKECVLRRIKRWLESEGIEPATPNRSTRELCGDQLHRGLSCILYRGHAGDHECHSVDAGRTVTWKQSVGESRRER